jgi:glycosyltransferase involved in cell wall biosynthesis
MKIIFIIHNITRSGGTEKATLQLSNSFVKRGFDVEIISIASKEGVNIFFEISPKIKVYHINGTGNKIVNFVKIRKLVNRSNPNIICGTGHNISFFLPFIKNKGSKIIAIEHIDFYSIPSLSQLMMKFSYAKLNGIVVLSIIFIIHSHEVNK